MREEDLTYHHRRSTMQRTLAERADSPAIAKLHRELARLHDDCVLEPIGRRRTLKIVVPT
ncbi:hypothetical protein H5J25_05390 [Sphingomonas aliaeris]|uniref:Uncharacterized protein n=1 Tax=Sphingomonas aliaeris TaxID=2759526 RepID=A0A974NWH7_9SPHN|nr:hypothetical protein [Sphingomonas aliaeris]QQV78153.1 hypothetical protein H5J25_05390 [Sphingomonas aliaeris]